jgi:hypothetical protein
LINSLNHEQNEKQPKNAPSAVFKIQIRARKRKKTASFFYTLFRKNAGHYTFICGIISFEDVVFVKNARKGEAFFIF